MDSNQVVTSSLASVKRGEMYYIKCDESRTSEKSCCYGGINDGKLRSAIVVSNNDENRSSSVIEIVYTTTKDKTKLPTHVKIKGNNGAICTALCEQVQSIDKSRIDKFIRTCSSYEMEQVSEAIKVSLDIKDKDTLNFGFSATNKLFQDVITFMTLLSEKCQKLNELDDKINKVKGSSRISFLSDLLDKDDMDEILEIATRKLNKDRDTVLSELNNLLYNVEKTTKSQNDVGNTEKEKTVTTKVVKTSSKSKRSYSKSKGKKTSERVLKIVELYKQGLPASEIAERMGISKQAVYSTKNYAIRLHLLSNTDMKS